MGTRPGRRPLPNKLPCPLPHRLCKRIRPVGFRHTGWQVPLTGMPIGGREWSKPPVPRSARPDRSSAHRYGLRTRLFSIRPVGPHVTPWTTLLLDHALGRSVGPAVGRSRAVPPSLPRPRALNPTPSPHALHFTLEQDLLSLSVYPRSCRLPRALRLFCYRPRVRRTIVGCRVRVPRPQQRRKGRR